MDESDRAHFVPIKAVVGDFFLAEIERQIYVFTLKGARILTKRQTATRSFRFVLYETSHVMPMNPYENKELEIVLEKNQLPKVNLMLFSVLKELGRREKKTKENTLDPPHRLMDLIEEVADDESRYNEQVRNIKEYLSHLKIEEICTPVQRLANFLDEDLIETDASFYGEVVSRFKRTDDEHKIIMNKPVKTSKHLVKWIAVGLMVALVAAAAVLLLGGQNMQAPDLGNLIPGFSMPGQPGVMTLEDFQKVYPTPLDAKKAVDSGSLSINQIPPQLRDIVKNFKPPVVTPVEPTKDLTVNLTP